VLTRPLYNQIMAPPYIMCYAIVFFNIKLGKAVQLISILMGSDYHNLNLDTSKIPLTIFLILVKVVLKRLSKKKNTHIMSSTHIMWIELNCRAFLHIHLLPSPRLTLLSPRRHA
jgi:hypothetical protein